MGNKCPPGGPSFVCSCPENFGRATSTTCGYPKFLKENPSIARYDPAFRHLWGIFAGQRHRSMASLNPTSGSGPHRIMFLFLTHCKKCIFSHVASARVQQPSVCPLPDIIQEKMEHLGGKIWGLLGPQPCVGSAASYTIELVLGSRCKGPSYFNLSAFMFASVCRFGSNHSYHMFLLRSTFYFDKAKRVPLP